MDGVSAFTFCAYTESPDPIPIRPEWHHGAPCNGRMELFFANHGEQYAEARALCESCPLLERCRADVLEREHGVHYSGRFGFAGGLSPRERWALDEKRVCVVCGELLPGLKRRYCGEECRRAATRAESAEKWLERKRAREAEKLKERDQFLMDHGLTPRQRKAS